jgi:hypothetical protein
VNKATGFSNSFYLIIVKENKFEWLFIEFKILREISLLKAITNPFKIPSSYERISDSAKFLTLVLHS